LYNLLMLLGRYRSVWRIYQLVVVDFTDIC